MATSEHVIWLQDCTGDCLDLVGGKARSLGALLAHDFQVPPGFVLSTNAYREHVQHNGLAESIERLLAEAGGSYETQLRAAEQIQALFTASRVPPGVAEAVLEAHAHLCDGQPDTPLAVRSSATAEDLATASFAGQQETYLWLLSAEQVLEHVLRCWASLFTPQAMAYRAHRGQPVADLAMGVVVQRMVAAEVAGVMLTIDPITGDRSTVTIEAAFGLGAAVVNGEVTPDRYCVDKAALQIRSRSIGAKTVAYRFAPAVQGVRLEPVPRSQQQQPCLADDEVLALTSLGARMEQLMGQPQDMEWAIGPERQIYLLQARPETVWSQQTETPLVN
jgi:pyruvate,water dikinase